MPLEDFEDLSEEEFFLAVADLWEEDVLARIGKREARYGISSGEAYARVRDGLLIATPDLVEWLRDFELAKREGLL